MARADGDAPVDVTEASATSGESAPMADAPVEPTDAQRTQQGGAESRPSEEALAQYREDQDWIREHPNEVRAREANPAIGGESFDYGRTVDEGRHPDNAPVETSEDTPDENKDNG